MVVLLALVTSGLCYCTPLWPLALHQSKYPQMQLWIRWVRWNTPSLFPWQVTASQVYSSIVSDRSSNQQSSWTDPNAFSKSNHMTWRSFPISLGGLIWSHALNTQKNLGLQLSASLCQYSCFVAGLWSFTWQSQKRRASNPHWAEKYYRIGQSHMIPALGGLGRPQFNATTVFRSPSLVSIVLSGLEGIFF